MQSPLFTNQDVTPYPCYATSILWGRMIKKVNFSEKKIQNLIESLYRKFTVFELSQDILLKSSDIRANHTFSFWDSVVAASALDCDADYLISEDMQDGFTLEKKLTIINPFT